MEIVIIDEEGKKVCIDTRHPYHSKIKDDVTYHATMIAKLAEASILESRMKAERESMKIDAQRMPTSKLENNIPEINHAQD